jgi:cell division protein FtsW
VTSEYRWERVKAWLDPWHDPQDAGFQIIQSLLAVGTGGVTGRGFMRGLQKNGFLPEPQTDFIFAVIAEEFGLIGALVVLAAFLIIAWRGYLVATRMPDRFGAFLALGLTTLIVAQAFINMSVVLGILPNKGLPLPFISAGGSSMLISMLAMGILLNVSQHAMSAPVRSER